MGSWRPHDRVHPNLRTNPTKLGKVEKKRRDIFAKLRKDITRKKNREREWKLLKERVFNEITKNEPLKIKRLQSEQNREDFPSIKEMFVRCSQC